MNSSTLNGKKKPSVCNMVIKTWKTQGLVQMKSLVLSIVYLYHIHLSIFLQYLLIVWHTLWKRLTAKCTIKGTIKSRSFKFFLTVITKNGDIASTSGIEDNLPSTSLKNTSKKHTYHWLIINTYNHINNAGKFLQRISNKSGIW